MEEIKKLTQNPGPELFKALCAFHATNPKALMNKVNPHFKSNYAPLEQVVAVAHSMAAYGLIVIQPVEGEEVITLLAHESGEYITSRTPIVAQKSTAQGYGSGVTYARRYALSAIIGIASEPDDDGNAATAAPPQNRRHRPPEKDKRPMTDKQMAHIRKLLRDAVGDDAKSVSDWLEQMGRPRVSAMSHPQGMWLVKALDGGGNPTISRESLGAFAAERAAKEVSDA